MSSILFKGLLFDLDGVLCDTARYHFSAWQKLANQLGIDFTKEHNEDLKGVSRVESLNYLLKLGKVKLADTEFKKSLALKNEWYLELVQSMNDSELLAGVSEFLTSVKKNNFKIGLGSSSKNAPLILNKLKITHLFDCIVDGNSVIKSKPDPEVFLTGASKLNLTPKECVVFEDATSGIDAANAGGFLSIGIGDSKTLNKANMVFKGFDELSFNTFLESINQHERTL